MRMHLGSSRSMLYRFFILYGSLYAGFGVQSPYLPILLDNHHLRTETIGLALGAGMAVRALGRAAAARDRHPPPPPPPPPPAPPPPRVPLLPPGPAARSSTTVGC